MKAKRSKKGKAPVATAITTPGGSVSRRLEATVSTLYEEYRGPIPSADELGKYEYVCQGAARDIIEMAKEEQKMRASSNAEEHKVHMQICVNAARGQLYAFLTFLALIGACCYAVHI